jgi:hypothetical protein
MNRLRIPLEAEESGEAAAGSRLTDSDRKGNLKKFEELLPRSEDQNLRGG